MALTAKQERFAQNIALKGMTQSAAYAEAYDAVKMKPETVSRAAVDLAANPSVSARIDVLKQGATRAAVKAAAFTLDDAIRESDENRLAALANGQTSAAVAATKLKAELSGHLTEKKADPKGSLDSLDVERLLELRALVEDKVERSREALAMTGAAAAPVVAPAAPIRRVING